MFHHFRKCAGTSLRAAFLASLARRSGTEPREGNPRKEVWAIGRSHFYAQEWGAFVPAHLKHEPPVVLVTCLRHPIERLHSEFHYAGPGSNPCLRGPDLLAAWTDWISQAGDPKSPGGVQRGDYVDNFFIRSLIGTPQSNVRIDLNVPYYGRYGIFGGGAPLLSGEISQQHLKLALQVLASFDIVLFSNWLNCLETARQMRSYLQDEEFQIGMARRSSARPEVPHEIYQILEQQNVWDLRLFEAVYEFCRSGAVVSDTAGGCYAPI